MATQTDVSNGQKIPARIALHCKVAPVSALISDRQLYFTMDTYCNQMSLVSRSKLGGTPPLSDASKQPAALGYSVTTCVHNEEGGEEGSHLTMQSMSTIKPTMPACTVEK